MPFRLSEVMASETPAQNPEEVAVEENKPVNGAMRLSDIQQESDSQTIEKNARTEYRTAIEDRSTYDEARKKIQLQADEDIYNSNMAELKDAGELNGKVSVYRPKAYQDISFMQGAMEVPGMVKRGLLEVAKAPGVLLKMAGESAPTMEERRAAYANGTESAWLSQKLDKAAVYLSQAAIKAGDNCIKYYNGISKETPVSKEVQMALEGSFLEHPVLKTTSAVAESGPSFGIAVASTILTRNPSVGLAVLGTTSATSTYEQLRKDGVDPDLARYGSAIVGSIEILTEKVPMDILLKGGRKRLIRALMTGTAESFQELLANMGQNYVTAVIKDIDPEKKETYLKAAKQEWSVISDGWQTSMAAGFVMGTGAAVLTDVEPTYKGEAEMREMYAIPEPGHENDFELAVAKIKGDVKAVEKTVTEQMKGPENSVPGKEENNVQEMQTAQVEQGGVAAPPNEISTTGVPGGQPTTPYRLAESVERQAIEAQLTDSFGELMQGTTINMKEQSGLALEFIQNEPERSFRVAQGLEPAPAGLYPENVYTAYVVLAKTMPDRARAVEVMRTLAFSGEALRVSRILGQRVKSLDTGDTGNDPVRAVQEIGTIRKEMAQKRGQAAPDPAIVADLQKKLDEAEQKLAAYEAQPPKGPENIPGKPEYGTKNRVVTKAAYEKELEAFRKRITGRTTSGIDPQDIVTLGKVLTYHIEAIGRNLAEVSAQTIKDLGDWVKPLLQAEYQKVLKQFDDDKVAAVTSSLTKAVKSGNPNSIAQAIGKVAQNFVEQGVTDREALVDAVFEFVKPVMPEITRRQVMDLISGYGKYKLLDKSEVKAILRDIKGQLQNIAKLEDLQAGEPLQKTGIERRIPTDEERRLIAQVNEAKKKYGVKTTDPATQLKSTLDAIKKRLANQIADLEFQIESGAKIVPQKTDPEYDQQALELKRQRDFLKEINDAIFSKEKKSLTDQQRVDSAVRAYTKAIKDRQSVIESGDIAPKKKEAGPTSALIEAFLKPQLEALNEELKLLRDAQKVKKSPDEIALQSLKSRLTSEIMKYETQFAVGDFALQEKKTVEPDDTAKFLKEKRDSVKAKLMAAREAGEYITQEEIQTIADLSKTAFDKRMAMLNGPRRQSAGKPTQTEMEYGVAQALFNKYVNGLKLKAEKTTFKEKFFEYAKSPVKLVLDVAGLSRNICASLDNSFAGRQGLKLFYKGLTGDLQSAKIWGQTFLDSYKIITKTFNGTDETMMISLQAMILSDPELDLVKKTGVDLGVLEEEIATASPAGVPVLGKPFKAAENAYNYSAWYMRYRVAKMYLEIWRNAGRDMANPDTLKEIGLLTNSLTGRGDTGQKSTTPGLINNIFFSPRNIKADIDFLTMHFFDSRMSGFAKRKAAWNLFRYAAGAAAILAIADFIDDDSVQWDPRNSDFGKIKVGSTRFTVAGSLPVLITLISRIVSNTYVSSITGEKKKLNSGKFKGRTSLDLVYSFLENKAAPATSALIELLKGETREGNIPTVAGQLGKMYTPLQIQNYFETQSLDNSANLLLIMMAEAHGVNVQSYEKKPTATGQEKRERKFY